MQCCLWFKWRCLVDKIESHCVKENQFAIFSDAIVLFSDFVHVYVCCVCCVLDFGYSSESLYTIVPPGQVSRVSVSGALVLLTLSQSFVNLDFSKLWTLTECFVGSVREVSLAFPWAPLVL